jgi:hypothetical protein
VKKKSLSEAVAAGLRFCKHYYLVFDDKAEGHLLDPTPELDAKWLKQLQSLKSQQPFSPRCYGWVKNRNK